MAIEGNVQARGISREEVRAMRDRLVPLRSKMGSGWFRSGLPPPPSSPANLDREETRALDISEVAVQTNRWDFPGLEFESSRSRRPSP